MSVPFLISCELAGFAAVVLGVAEDKAGLALIGSMLQAAVGLYTLA